VGCVSEAADGFIIYLVNSGWSHVEIKSSLGVSGVRMDRISAEIQKPALRSEKLQPHTPCHAFGDVVKGKLPVNQVKNC
jgi:hypothetical protein